MHSVMFEVFFLRVSNTSSHTTVCIMSVGTSLCRDSFDSSPYFIVKRELRMSEVKFSENFLTFYFRILSGKCVVSDNCEKDSVLMGKKWTIYQLELSSAISQVQNRETSFSLCQVQSSLRNTELLLLYFWLLFPRVGFLDCLDQGFSKITFKGPNRNYHQRQKVRNNCYYKTCFYKHAYNFI